MLYVPQINDYLEILTDKDVKDFLAINVSWYFKYITEGQNLRKAAKLIYIFLTPSDELEKYVQSNYSDNCAHHYNVEISNLLWSRITTD